MPTGTIILIEVNGFSKSLTQWAKELGITNQSLNTYFHRNGEEKIKERIEKYLKGEIPKGRINTQKYEIGCVVNDYEILDRFYDDCRKLHFDLKCTKCGYIYKDVRDSILMRENSCPNHQIHEKRGHKTSSIYQKLRNVFNGMKQRCYNPECEAYKWYGAKGIKICGEWLNNPEKFINWGIQSGYQDNLTIDRIDSNKDYEPSNCQWISKKNNTKRIYESTFITVRGISDSYLGWSKRLNIAVNTLCLWIKQLGKDKAVKRIEDVLDGHYEVYRFRYVTVNGITKTLTEWSNYFGKQRGYFMGLNHRKGLDAVKSKIEELLSKQEDNKND